MEVIEAELELNEFRLLYRGALLEIQYVESF